MRNPEHGAQEVIVVQLGDGLDMPAGQDQEVNRRLGIDVVKDGDVLVSIHRFGVGVADQATEDAVRHTTSSSCPARLPFAGAVGCR